ncbi:MAG: hypothetical protein AAF561_11155 [Planctomycetota bacterium]
MTCMPFDTGTAWMILGLTFAGWYVLRSLLVAGSGKRLTPVQQTKHCASCRQHNPGHARFCRSCGNKLAP